MGKYVTCQQIASMISRNNKNLVYDIYDIVEWCGEAVNNIGEYESFERFSNVEIEVIDKKALLPCNVWRVLKVSGNNCSDCTIYNYVNNGTYLSFSDNSLTNGATSSSSPPSDGTIKLRVDYIGIAIDSETGYPLILEGHEQACYWYCMTKLYMEDFLSGKMDGQRYNFIQEQYGKYVSKAKSSMRHTSRDDMDKMAMIRYNMIRSVRMPKNNFK